MTKESKPWFRLGMTCLRERRFGEAVDAFRRALDLNPRDAQTATNLSVALLHSGQPAEAETHARQAVEWLPSEATFWANLGACSFQQLRWPEALSAFQQAASLAPDNADILANLGIAQQRCGHLADAERTLQQSLAIEPNNIHTLVSYASLLTQRGKPAEALPIVQDVLQQHPQHAQAWLTAGNALKALGDPAQATLAMRRALQFAPAQLDVRLNLAALLFEQWLDAEAESILREIVRDHPRSAGAWALLAGICDRHAKSDEALAALRHAITLQPHPGRHSTLLLQEQYADNVTAASLLPLHRQWNELYARPLLPTPPPGLERRAPNGPLRIGFVSPEFALHPVGFLALRAIEQLDRAHCSVACYSDRRIEDRFTARFREASELWRVTTGLTDEEIAEQIRADQIDLLVDLMGHTSRRLLIFARKPAPQQMTWLGYPGTTGMDAMDFLLADSIHIRTGEESFYSETVLRMPHDYVCYGPQDDVPAVGPLPALSTGQVTFGCFNHPAKFSTTILDTWAQILRRLPTSRLLLKYGTLGEPLVKTHVWNLFAQRGIHSSRVLLESKSPHHELLNTYNRVDLALDTQPYSGGLTTCEALWMGVPVITWPGNSFAGRHSTSHLTTASLSQFIAPDNPGYINLAEHWATHLHDLAQIRTHLRSQLSLSPLCDAPKFATDFLKVGRWSPSAKRNE